MINDIIVFQEINVKSCKITTRFKEYVKYIYNMKTDTSLYDNWQFYLHLHENDDWSIESYINMMKVSTVEDAIILNDEINYDLIKKTMMFVMKKDILPIWEDNNNKDGGCFSYKILNKDIEVVWGNVYYSLLGRTITKNTEDYDCINGITLSPKKKFCILKIWMKDCTKVTPDMFIDINEMNPSGCIFRKHCPNS